MVCVKCGGNRTERRNVEVAVDAADRKFTCSVPADVCVACGESFIDAGVLSRAELEAAQALADAGVVSDDTFRYMRHAMGFTARELGAEIGVAPETISRWENRERPLDRLAWVTLAAMVRDRLDGSDRTRAQLRAMRSPKRLAKTVRLEMATKSATR